MVLEQLVSEKWLERRHVYALLLGFVYSLIGAIVSKVFFGNAIGIPMVFMTSLLLIPSLMKLFDLEEKKEAKAGLKHFVKNHEEVFVIYLFLSLGMIIFYLVLGALSSQSFFIEAFDYQLKQAGLFNAASMGGQITLSSVAPNVMHLIQNNIVITVFAFILSVFYGAGAVFLITYNASVFAIAIAAVGKAANSIQATIVSSLILSIHLVPEVSSYLVAAIAGGVLSKALVKEKWGSKKYNKVLKDSFLLFGIAILLVFFAAMIETYVTPVFIASIV